MLCARNHLSKGDFYGAKIGSQRVLWEPRGGEALAKLQAGVLPASHGGEVKVNQEGDVPGTGATGTKAWRYPAGDRFQN